MIISTRGKDTNTLEYIRDHCDAVELPHEDKLIVALICWKYTETYINTGETTHSKRLMLAAGEMDVNDPNQYIFTYQEPGFSSEDLYLPLSGYVKTTNTDPNEGTTSFWEIYVVDYVVINLRNAFDIRSSDGYLLDNEEI